MQTSPDSQLAPRLKHNLTLATKYLADHGIYARYPRVTKQAECLPLDLVSLPDHAYNPSILNHNGMWLMAYRYHEGTLATKLGLAQIDITGRVLTNRMIDLKAQSAEDPKLFTHKGRVCMSWVDSTWPEIPPKSVVRYGMFKDGTITDIKTPKLPGNDGTTLQKNWVFFSL